MAVEYDISSDVAVIKETGSVSQCARVTQMYSGQITYDDEAGSKFATATINGKSQRVMLCIAVSGTVTYDDVPSLYSTVDGHRCLNIVTPTETGTPDDVPSLYETVVIDGQNVRAVRCIMINKTPVYDGVSSVCTFTGDDGKTHTAQLVNKITGGSVQVIIKGTSPLNLPDAIANSLSCVKAFGGTEQNGTPTPDTPMDIVSNNGVLKYGKNLFDKNDSGIGDGYISAATGAITGSSRGHTGYFRVKPNTTYHVTLDVYQSGSTNGIAFYDNDKNFVVGLTSNTSYGNPPYNFTVPNNNSIVYARLTLTNNIARTNLDVIQIEQGESATPYVPYGIYTDGTVETINAHGKNLINNDACRRYEEEDDVPTTNRYGWLITLPAGTYTISQGAGNTSYVRYSADNGSTWSSYATISENVSRTYTFDTETLMYVYGTGSDGLETQKAKKVQLELGSTATEYAPYYDGGTATAEMLLKVGDYQDVQSMLDGKVTRNVGVKVLNGTEEGWVKTNNSFANTSFIADKKIEKSTLFCSHFQYNSGSTSTILDMCVGCATTSINTYFRYDALSTVEQWKQWLTDQYANGTPVIVIYPLATPTTESVAGQTLQVTDGDNIVEITQASLNGLELEAKYQAAVSLTIQEVQDANLDNSVEVTIS